MYLHKDRKYSKNATERKVEYAREVTLIDTAERCAFRCEPPLGGANSETRVIASGHCFGTRGIWLGRRAGMSFITTFFVQADSYPCMTYNPYWDAYSFTVSQQFPAICDGSPSSPDSVLSSKKPIPALISCMIAILITSHLHLVFPGGFFPLSFVASVLLVFLTISMRATCTA
jgi:hypothetical protein